MLKRFLTVGLVCGLIGLFTGKAQAVGGYPYTVSGCVMTTFQVPIQGATVTVWCKAMYSDLTYEVRSATLTSDAQGNYSVDFSFPTHFPATLKTVQIIVDASKTGYTENSGWDQIDDYPPATASTQVLMVKN